MIDLDVRHGSPAYRPRADFKGFLSSPISAVKCRIEDNWICTEPPCEESIYGFISNISSLLLMADPSLIVFTCLQTLSLCNAMCCWKMFFSPTPPPLILSKNTLTSWIYVLTSFAWRPSKFSAAYQLPLPAGCFQKKKMRSLQERKSPWYQLFFAPQQWFSKGIQFPLDFPVR